MLAARADALTARMARGSKGSGESQREASAEEVRGGKLIALWKEAEEEEGEGGSDRVQECRAAETQCSASCRMTMEFQGIREIAATRWRARGREGEDEWPER